MAATTYSMEQLQSAAGVTARTLRHWIREKLLPKPIGRGRSARYDDRHLVRARAIRHLRSSDLSLNAIYRRISALSEDELAKLAPSPERPQTAEGRAEPPTPPSYPSDNWEIVRLMDGMILMLNPARGEVLRRVADDIYRHYAVRRSAT